MIQSRQLGNPRVLMAMALPLLLMSCHSDPFGVEHYGPETTLIPGVESRLTYGHGDKYGHPFHVDAVSWSEDGSGIVFIYGPRAEQVGESLGQRCGLVFCSLATRDSLDTCAGMLPGRGGGAFWEVCEIGSKHTDSLDVITGAAVDRAGQIIYAERTQRTDVAVGLGGHTDLWLADPYAAGPRKHVLAGAPYSDIQWAGPSGFFARTVGDVVIGSILAESVVVRAVPGTDGAIAYSVIDGGQSVITVSGDNVVKRVQVSDGTIGVAALPPVQGAHTLDVSCANAVCIVLTVGGSPTTWTIWKLDLGTGLATVARTFDHAISSAKLSPASGRVVTLESGNLFLLDLTVQ